MSDCTSCHVVPHTCSEVQWIELKVEGQRTAIEKGLESYKRKKHREEALTFSFA